MKEEPVVEMSTVLVAIRIADMEAMCRQMSKVCADAKRESLSRRFGAAAKSFKSMLEDLTQDARQLRLIGGG